MISIPITQFSARQVQPTLVISDTGMDIMKGLASQNLIKFSYSDSTSDKADGLDVEVADPERTWMQQYMPKKGIECKAGFVIYNWAAPGDNRTFEMGTFFINEINLKGPPNVITIKASSIPVQSQIKNEKKHKSWENADLKSIAGAIAQQNGLTLFYDTQQNPKVKRTDQVDKSDLVYLRDRVKEASLSLKIHNKKLIIYSEMEYDQKPAAFSFTYGKSNILEWDFISKVDDTYKEAENSYVDPETGKLVKEKFTPEEPPEGSFEMLRVNERNEVEPDDPDPEEEGGGLMLATTRMGIVRVGVRDTAPEGLLKWEFDGPANNSGKGKGSKGSSKRKAKAKLREKNKKEKESTIKLIGDPAYLSSLNCQLVDFGIFSDKWFISEAKHDIDTNGYTAELKLRKTLKGY